tara:strand:- start:12 stop:1325 length:1314 start_codon:yes stop_codon:yes gene_type:complete
MKKFDVIIIGGGLSGITSFIDLNRKKLNVLLLEKSSYLGGRAFSFQDPSTNEYIDNGQHVIVGACEKYIDLMDSTNNMKNFVKIKNYQVPVFKKNKISMLGSKFISGSIGLLLSLLFYKHLSFWDKKKLIKCLLKIKFKKIDSIINNHNSFRDWLNKNEQSEDSIKYFWDIILKPSLNQEIETISTRYALFVIKQTFFSNKPQFFGLPKTNLSSLWSDFEKRNSSNILKKTIVKKLNVDNKKIKSIVTNNGDELFAKYFIFATQYSSTIKILKDSNIELTNDSKLETSPILGIHFWFKNQITDQRFIASAGSEIQWIFNVSKNHNKKDNHIVISQSASNKWMKMNKNTIKEIFLKELEFIYPLASPKNLEKYTVVKQKDATFLCNRNNEYIRNNAPVEFENLFYSGDWTDTSWPSTMEGAVISGKTTSQRILDSIKR